VRPARNPADPEPLLELREVTKEFPVSAGFIRRTTGTVKAVSGVSLAIAAGETFGLVGESGCGKTTIGRIAVALERPGAGAVVFDGTDLATADRAAVRKARRDLQLMFQDPYSSLDPQRRHLRAARPLVHSWAHPGDPGARPRPGANQAR
jgi:ABC-type oligopeptide transport system ATPase subunit